MSDEDSQIYYPVLPKCKQFRRNLEGCQKPKIRDCRLLRIFRRLQLYNSWKSGQFLQNSVSALRNTDRLPAHCDRARSAYCRIHRHPKSDLAVPAQHRRSRHEYPFYIAFNSIIAVLRCGHIDRELPAFCWNQHRQRSRCESANRLILKGVKNIQSTARSDKSVPLRQGIDGVH